MLLGMRERLSIRVECYDAVVKRSDQELPAAVHIECAENAGEVMAHGCAANAEAAGDIFVGQALPDQGDDVMLAFCEVPDQFGRTGIRWSMSVAEPVFSNGRIS